MSDPLVFKTQKWVNDTYKGRTGFNPVELTGKTGWDTINALTKALQIELGITALSNNFGPTTARLFDQIAPTLKIKGNYSTNVVKILQCALWCKGYDMYDQSYFGEFTSYTEKSIKQIRVDCGLADSMEDSRAVGSLNSMIMKSLLNMQAFVRVPWGDPRIRDMQRKLNREYYPYFGLLPCDGVYQRETNQALIYGLQCEMGMPVGTANGFFGAGTTTGCPTLSKTQGTAANIKLLQYALYVNGEYTSLFDGIYSDAVVRSVINFRKFMKIGHQDSGVADMPVIKALLSTTGDTARPAQGFDASTRMTQEMINTVKASGMKYAGRYLTGTVGVGANRRPKNLTIPEARLLLKNGINIVPIYQDNSALLSDYSEKNGLFDGVAAFQRAFELGIPSNSIIYFAVDVDTTEDQIWSYIVPYFKGIEKASQIFRGSWNNQYHYIAGVYAPRNVCKVLKDEQLVSPKCYVSNMSSGFSANLGYPQPKDWAFDQFYEPPYGVGSGTGHIYIDKVAVSGRDLGVNNIHPELNQLREVVKEFSFSQLTNILYSGNVSFDKEITIADIGVAKITFKPTLGLSPTQGNQVFRIVNGNIDGTFNQEIIKNFDGTYAQSLMDGAESLTGKIKNGNISVSVGATSSGKLSYAVTVNVIDYEFESGTGKTSFSFTFKIEIQKTFFDNNQLGEVWDNLGVASAIVIAVIVVGLLLYFGSAIVTVGALAAFFSLLLIP